MGLSNLVQDGLLYLSTVSPFTTTSGGRMTVLDPYSALGKQGIAYLALTNLSMGSDALDTCRCALACETLYGIFGPDQVTQPGEESYDATRPQFWSAFQSENAPRCFFHPSSAEDVSAAVLLSSGTQCPFAVKGAGHTPFKGASNSDGGITMDFKYMKEVTVSVDRKTVAIGPGNNWGDVYSTLEPHGLNIVGGRVATVGVSGLVLGGGISFFSGLRGWACDNIASYEVVLASGEIVTAGPGSHPDLYWALRGGSGNFGIVTKFEAYTFQQGMIWGGMRMVESTANNASLIAAFADFCHKGSIEEPGAAVLLTFIYAQIYNMWIQASQLTHPDPQPEGAHPKVFDAWFDVAGPAVMDTMSNRFQSNMTAEVAANSPNGLRQIFHTMSAFVDEKLIHDVVEIWRQETAPLANLTGLIPTLTIQILPVSSFKAMGRNGGNALGLEGGTRPLLNFMSNFGWALPSDDHVVRTAVESIWSRAIVMAKERGLYHPFRYINYSDGSDDPISSYGPENKEKLLRVSRKYDPHGVFQKLHPGHFKLDKES